MNRKSKVFVAVHMAAALLVSVAGCKHTQEALTPKVAAAPAGAPAPAPSPAPAPAPAPAPSTADERIVAARKLTESEPKNAKAWVALGNEYFDSQQKVKAVEAYAKALQLRPDDPDVLTDQGILYRELGAFDQAIANFEKASKIDPKHLQSLLNLGLLYAQDMKDDNNAIASWNRVIQAGPATTQAAKAREYIDRLRPPPTPR